MNKVNNMSLNACMIWWPQFGARHDSMHQASASFGAWHQMMQFSAQKNSSGAPEL